MTNQIPIEELESEFITRQALLTLGRDMNNPATWLDLADKAEKAGLVNVRDDMLARAVELSN